MHDGDGVDSDGWGTMNDGDDGDDWYPVPSQKTDPRGRSDEVERPLGLVNGSLARDAFVLNKLPMIALEEKEVSRLANANA